MGANSLLLTTTNNYNVWHNLIIIFFALLFPAYGTDLVTISRPYRWELEQSLDDRVHSPEAPALGGLNSVDHRMGVDHLGVERHCKL